MPAMKERAMQEALRTYLELATGLTDASRKKEKNAVKDAVGQSGATADQLKTLTTALLAANSANRDGLVKLVRFEVDRALGVVGLATAEEVAELTARVRDLDRQLSEARAGTSLPGPAEPAHTVTPAAAVPAAKSETKKAVTKKAGTRKATKAKATTAIPTPDQLARTPPATRGPRPASP